MKLTRANISICVITSEDRADTFPEVGIYVSGGQIRLQENAIIYKCLST